MKILLLLSFVYLSIGTFNIAWASQTADFSRASGPQNCSDMEVWDTSMAMCMPFPMAGMPMQMLMFHSNLFLMKTFEQGPRGRSAFSVPNMFMADVGSSIGDRQYVNLAFMGTLEKWTYPSSGTPEQLQIGESQASGAPFLDAQHPHSSPVMGLTLSDTIALSNDKDHLKIWFAPRGESTDGPIAFMHRPTGVVNPDAPLGHHIGQDVGHISSTVFGALGQVSSTSLEVSVFNGTEPSPSKVDLSMGTPNSFAARVRQQFSNEIYAMASLAYVKSPEPGEPLLSHIWRYSASIYGQTRLPRKWTLNEALIWGLINGYDNAAALNSFAEEFWLQKTQHNIWGRIEVLQRTPTELEIADDSQPNKGQWVTAVTLGYTHDISTWESGKLSLGGSFTTDFLPDRFQKEYGQQPGSEKIFLQISEMKMWGM